MQSFVDSSAHKVSVVPGVLVRHSFSALNVMTILEPEMAGEASRRKSAIPTQRAKKPMPTGEQGLEKDSAT